MLIKAGVNPITLTFSPQYVVIKLTAWFTNCLVYQLLYHY